jgi:hypothetical protein
MNQKSPIGLEEVVLDTLLTLICTIATVPERSHPSSMLSGCRWTSPLPSQIRDHLFTTVLENLSRLRGIRESLQLTARLCPPESALKHTAHTLQIQVQDSLWKTFSKNGGSNR